MLDIFAQTFGFWFLALLLYVMVAECRACDNCEEATAKPAQRPVSFANFWKTIATSAIFPRF